MDTVQPLLPTNPIPLIFSVAGNGDGNNKSRFILTITCNVSSALSQPYLETVTSADLSLGESEFGKSLLFSQ